MTTIVKAKTANIIKNGGSSIMTGAGFANFSNITNNDAPVSNPLLSSIQSMFEHTILTDFQGFLMPLSIEEKSSNYVVTAADNGKLFLSTAAVSFTLPTIKENLNFAFYQVDNSNMSVVGNSNIVALNSDGASLLSFSTTNQKIGSHIILRAQYVEGTLKWVTSLLTNNMLTVV